LLASALTQSDEASHPDVRQRAAEGEIDLLAAAMPELQYSWQGLGLEDESRGLLVFEFARLIEELQPRAFLMETGSVSVK
jgi:site-specific DNA-cytosine methylase